MSEPEQQVLEFYLTLGTGTGSCSNHIISVTTKHVTPCCSIYSGTHEIAISLYLKHNTYKTQQVV